MLQENLLATVFPKAGFFAAQKGKNQGSHLARLSHGAGRSRELAQFEEKAAKLRDEDQGAKPSRSATGLLGIGHRRRLEMSGRASWPRERGGGQIKFQFSPGSPELFTSGATMRTGHKTLTWSLSPPGPPRSCAPPPALLATATFSFYFLLTPYSFMFPFWFSFLPDLTRSERIEARKRTLVSRPLRVVLCFFIGRSHFFFVPWAQKSRGVNFLQF